MTRFFLLATMLVATPAFACGPYFPCSYIVYGGQHFEEMPRPIFDLLAAEIIADTHGVAMGAPAEKRADARSLLERTRDQDLQDLQDALSGPNAADLVAQYGRVRELLEGLILARLDEIERGRWVYPRPAPPAPIAFDLGAQAALLAALPAEFAHYLRGAVAYHEERFDDAIAEFEAILALPETDRQNRSVWAAFMLGKVWTRVAPSQATAYFEQTRELAQAGYRDTLGLAPVSRGWEARAALEAEDYCRAIQNYVTAYVETAGDPVIFESLKRVCIRASDSETALRALAGDPLCRRIMNARLLSLGDLGALGIRWLDVLETNPPTDPQPGADHLAWTAYRAGDFDAAARWLDFADPESPWSLWVSAKLALREGRFADAETALARAQETFAGGPTVLLNPNELESMRAVDVAGGDLGMLHLRNEAYTEALEAFARAGYWGEAAYVAERIMPVDALRGFVETHAGTILRPPADEAWLDRFRPQVSRLRHVLARRLAREGRWADAAPYYPPNEDLVLGWGDEAPEAGLAALAQAMAQDLQRANDASLPNGLRAEALVTAAERMRAWGLELMGTELGPDWNITAGSFDLGTWIGSDDLRARGHTPTAAEAARFTATAPDDEHRFHYRYLAAEMMWRAAGLLPDNDVRTARALYLGGQYIQSKDPQAADKFYKALVRRNPNLLIAQQADELRWFPAAFSEVVLYTPRDEPPFRRRDVALGLGALAVLLGAAGFGLYRRRQFAEA